MVRGDRAARVSAAAPAAVPESRRETPPLVAAFVVFELLPESRRETPPGRSMFCFDSTFLSRCQQAQQQQQQGR